MTDLRKRLSVTTLAFLALAFSVLLIGQAIANSERVRDVNADNSIETGVPLPALKGPTSSALSNEIPAPGLAPGDETMGDGSLIVKLKRTPPVIGGIAKGLGDEITTPFIIGAIPYTYAGDNTGGVDLWSAACGGTDPCVDYGYCVADQWFAYTPAANIAVDITTCNGPAGGDQLLVVYEDNSSTPIACSDDACAYMSRIVNVAMTTGHTYYIFLDGWAEGPYQLDITEYVPPPEFDEAIWSASTEAEVELCGERTNGGTYGNPTGTPPWPNTALTSAYLTGQLITGNIVAPQVLTGTADLTLAYSTAGTAFNGTSRDCDSWRWRQTTWQRVKLTFQAEIDLSVFIVSGGTGAAFSGGVNLAYQSPVPALTKFEATLLFAPNTWYTLNLRANTMAATCADFPTTGPRYYYKTEDLPLSPIDDCPLALEYSGDTPVGTPIVIDMTTTTTDGTFYYPYPPYNGVYPFFGSAWIKFTPTESGYYTFSACTTPNVGDPAYSYDLFMAVYYAPCMPVAGNELGFSDDGTDCPGYEPQIGEGTREAIVPSSGVVMGENIDYLIGIGDWFAPDANDLDRGDAWIEIWHEPLPLLNNNCAVYRTPIVADEFAQFFHNLGSTLDGPAVSACNANEFGGDVWYEVTAWQTGHLFAKFCDVNFDANVEVYAGTTCPTNANTATLLPIRCNDDGCPDMSGNNGSYVEFPVVSGEQYIFRVGGWYRLPDYPLTAYGMGFGWYDMFITNQPDTLKGPTLFGTTTVPETVGLPVNDLCTYPTPVALVDGVALHQTGNQNWMTRDACPTLPASGVYASSDTWHAFTVPAGGCMKVTVDYFGYVDLCLNTSRYGATMDKAAVLWIGCPCEGDFFSISADKSCLNPNTCGALDPPSSDFNNYHLWTMLPSGDYWFMNNHWTIGGICGWGDYSLNITGYNTPCVYCAASSNPAQCTNLGSWINRVILKLALPTNMPGDTVINNSVAGTGCHNYEDFTGLMVKVYRGFDYALQVRYAKVNEGNYQYDTAGYWVDWNQNAVFFDPGEKYIAPHGTPIEGRVFDTMSVPMTALAPGTGGSGQTLMRIRLASTGDVGQPTTCGIPMFGEVEDYVLTVKDLECGDFNIDGVLNGDDIAFLVAYYFGTGPAPRIWQRADIDGIGGITIADIIGLADAAYRGGALNCGHM